MGEARRGGLRQRLVPGRPTAVVVTITAGYVAVAVSSVALLGAGPRILGPAAFSTLALVWTLSSVFGLGLGTPTEQAVTRRISAGEPGALRPLGWLLLWAGVVVLLLLLLGDRLPAASTGSGLVPGAVLAVVGWVGVTAVRGRLAGQGHLTRYAVVLGAEALLRMVFVLLAVLLPEATGSLLAASVGGPLALSAAIGAVALRRLPVPSPSTTDPERGDGSHGKHSGEHLQFGVVSIAYQVCLNGPALALDWKVGHTQPALVGAFVAVSTVLRSPSLLVGGLSTQALVTLSSAWASRDLSSYAASTRVLARRWAALVMPTTLLVLVLSPWLLPLYYGSSLEVSAAVVVSLAVSTLVATAAAVGTGPLFAAGRGRTAAVAWAAGAVVTTALVVASAGDTTVLVAGLVCGPLVAGVIVLRAVALTIRSSELQG
ncbi:lipopolysaccharide biosynthesis protein [Phycicoccus sp. Soil748]|uniref:lipopolysaccharide biosynthesis protein n=1 Tax=Phycicoccus sp. Soil748 TaxID=1736397 RepID=UPI0012E33D71|nr:hypothetical protein [Phycicoccus sp. Soil748]